MQADAFRTLFRLEVTADGIGDHRVQFCERTSLRGDAATVARRVPARDVAAGFAARLNVKGDFAHGGKLRANSIKVNESPGFGFGFRLAVQGVELAGGGIAFHLFVPFVVLERMQQCLQLATLLQRELVNRSLDFSNRAHAGKLSAMRFGVNAAKLDLPQRRKGAEKIANYLTGVEFEIIVVELKKMAK